MRAILVGLVLSFTPVGRSAEPAKGPADPWVGRFVRHHRSWNDKEREQFSITKRADGSYQLSGKGYDTYKFTEVEKGVLSDGKGGIGKLILGEVKFADGPKSRVIRAEFCYEQFLLHDVWGDAAR